jgi:hypothetical protein
MKSFAGSTVVTVAFPRRRLPCPRHIHGFERSTGKVAIGFSFGGTCNPLKRSPLSLVGGEEDEMKSWWFLRLPR